MNDKYKEKLLEALRYVFENDEDIEVLDIIEDERNSYNRWAQIKIKKWWIGPDDFEHEYVPADEDYCAHVETSFTLEGMQRCLPQYFYKQVINSGRVVLSRFESGNFGKDKQRICQNFSVNKSEYQSFSIYFDFIPGYDKKIYGLVEIDDEYLEQYYENPPEIKEYYTPMVVRGVMDADPEEYDFEILGYDQIDVIIYVKVR